MPLKMQRITTLITTWITTGHCSDHTIKILKYKLFRSPFNNTATRAAQCACDGSHSAGPPTHLSSFISGPCTRVPGTPLVGSRAHPKLSHLCEAAHPVCSSCHASHSRGNPSHPPKPSSSVISSGAALLISPQGGRSPPSALAWSVCSL